MKKRDIAIGIGAAAGAAIALKMLLRADAVEWDDVSDEVPHHEHSHFVNVDGLRVHFQEFGDPTRPTILLIHGYTASVYVWHAAAPRLADAGYHVIAVDLLGFGFSAKPGWFDYSIGSQANFISRFMNRLGIGRAVVIGSSYGGAVAATLALDYPERVEKLVLVDAVCNADLKSHPLLRLASVPGIGEVITPFIADSRILLRRRMHGTLAPANHHLITDERIESILRPLRARDAHRSLLLTSRNWEAGRIEEDANLINQPTLIVWGEEDQIIPIRDGHTLHDAILHSRLVVMRSCGHVPQEENPELFAEIVAEFLSGRKRRIEDPREAEALRKLHETVRDPGGDRT